MDKQQLEKLLTVGAKIKIGKDYAEGIGGLKDGEVITLIDGYFEGDNGLFTFTEHAPSIANGNDFDSIYHLFGNNLEFFMDCKIIEACKQ